MAHESGERGGANLFQSPFWAAHKERFGWRPVIDSGDPPLVLLLRSLGGPFSICYLPYGGAFEAETHHRCPDSFDLHPFLSRITAALEHARERPTFIRWDIPFPKETISASLLEKAGLRKAAVDVQPPDTVVLSLDPSEEELLSNMKQKTRYNIGLAAKRGVEVRIEEPGVALEAWYELYRETAERDRIAIHRFDYYRSLFDLAGESRPELLLYHAYHQQQLLAGIVVARFGPAAYYLYGASSNEKRNLMPAYALQWQAIRDAKEAGCRSYDFFGIPPAEDPDHPMYGLYRFKVGFGGQILRRPGAWDLPLKRVSYALFRRAEGARDYYYKVIRKRRR
ncbi:MAG: lipid II:glycine glycyltransferase FemX [Alkalispirochaetaceae bacterium]